MSRSLELAWAAGFFDGEGPYLSEPKKEQVERVYAK